MSLVAQLYTPNYFPFRIAIQQTSAAQPERTDATGESATVD